MVVAKDNRQLAAVVSLDWHTERAICVEDGCGWRTPGPYAMFMPPSASEVLARIKTHIRATGHIVERHRTRHTEYQIASEDRS